MKDTLFEYIIKELAVTIDESSMPQTSTSSLGLKLAVKIHPSFKRTLNQQSALSKAERFANAAEEFLLAEFGYATSAYFLHGDYIQFIIDKCPFQKYQSKSLCSIMQGIIGGLGLMTFGYCKLIALNGPDRAPEPCYVDIYTAPTAEAEKKSGIEYSKRTIALLQSAHNEDRQHQAQSNIMHDKVNI